MSQDNGNAQPTPAGHDSPVSRKEDDLLNRWSVARAVDRVIEAAPEGWSTRVGLHGAWGFGKTSVLRFLRQMREGRGDVVVELSAWQAATQADVILRFHGELLAELNARKIHVEPLPQKFKRWFNKAAPVGDAISSTGAKAGGALHNDTGQIVTALSLSVGLASAAAKDASTPTKEDLEKLQAALGERRVVVLIDDLDRADPKLVPKTLLGLRELLDWPNFAFILAFDKRVVGGALAEYSAVFGQSADGFLEKVIDVSVTLPEPTVDQVTRFALHAMEAICDFIPAHVRQDTARFFPTNPRQTKQVARALAALRLVATRHDERELNWTAIVLQTILRVFAPAAAATLEAAPLPRTRLATLGSSKGTEPQQSWVENMVECDAPPPLLLEGEKAERKQRLRVLIEKIVSARLLEKSAQAMYEMRLLVDEPPFSRREVQALIDRFQASPASASVEIELREAEERSNYSREECACALVDKSLSLVEEARYELSHATKESEHDAFTRQLTLAFDLLEHLAKNDDSALKLAFSRLDSVKQVVEDAAAVVHGEGDSTSPLSVGGRLTTMAMELAPRCTSPWSLYGHVANRKSQGLNSRAEAVFESVRRCLAPIIAEKVLHIFRQADGLKVALNFDSEASQGGLLQILEDVGSPVYEGTARGRLVELLRGAREMQRLEAEAIIDNALYYLTTISMISVSSTWIRDYAAFGAACNDILKAAWHAALGGNPRFMDGHFLIKLRQELITRGLQEDLFEQPAWMQEAVAAMASHDI